MADGGYIFDEDLDQEFLDYEKYSYFCSLGSNDEAFGLTMKAFKINDEELKKIIDKYNKDDNTNNE